MLQPRSPFKTQDGVSVVDLEDEASWEGLSPAAKDRLRAERARRQAEAVASPEPADEGAHVPGTDLERPPTRSAPRPRNARKLETYYKDKGRHLVIATAVLGGAWAVLISTSIGLASTGSGTPALYGTLGTLTSAAGLGTIVSGTLLGAHRNTRPLYFTAGRGGIGLRF